ncbi:MAG TPA: long-chain fatty acid--CoA ligase, partial [Acidimicrobiales bacterium]|nr:long-chain fatty acid--CoA ligase [Acidimicrobiales bacterium]
MKSDVNWFGVLAHHASRAPERAITVFEGRATSYAEMAARATALAGGLHERGVGPGDVVGLLSFNCPEFLQTVFAANYLGAIAMPINWRLAAPEVHYILEHSGARALVCDESLRALGEEATSALQGSLLRACTAPGPDAGWIPLAELESDDGAPPRVPTGPDDVHRLMYTSGTTGRPKGVMITHANLAWKNLAHIVEFGFTAADLGLACGPLYHVGALDLTTTSLIAVGATTIIHRAFDAAAVVDELERSRVTTVWLAPAMVNAIMALPRIEQRDLSSVRVIINGGEKMPIPLIERIGRTFPSAWFADAYGLTETVSGDTFLDRDNIVAKLGSVGRPCLHLQLEIWDEQGRPVPPGERGEIVMRGPKVFKGYWRDPEATERAFAGGWFHTGDIGVRDQDGYVFIVDRLKDMILSGGENIAGSEVERVLYEHPGVLEAAVVGRPDPRWGEVPVAFVVLRPGQRVTADELVEH